jgi:serine/threonine-protein kinase
MEYLEGVDLAELVQVHGRLPPTEAVDYVLQACEAVAEAHALGIVHRDLKPSNFLLARRQDGAPLLKVLDFGISKTHDEEDSKLTTTRAVFGSPAYMSPEQIRSAKHVDCRSDIWALAVVLYELLTGQLPFLGETASAILAAVAADAPTPLATYIDVPAGLQDVIEKCLIKDRERRVGSVLEMASLLAPFASPAGMTSVEVVRRIALAPRPSQIPSGRQSGASFPPVEGFETTMQQVTSPSRSGRRHVADPHATRTDRAIVVASQRTLGSRGPLLVAFALGAVGAVLAVATLATQSGRAKADPNAISVTPIPETPVVSAEVASTPSPALPSASSPAPAVAAPAPPAAAIVAPVVAKSSRSTPRPGGHASRQPTASAAPSATAPPPAPSPTPTPTPAPAPSPVKLHGHVDTDSRQ